MTARWQGHALQVARGHDVVEDLPGLLEEGLRVVPVPLGVVREHEPAGARGSGELTRLNVQAQSLLQDLGLDFLYRV